jgi:hypothetical protein
MVDLHKTIIVQILTNVYRLISQHDLQSISFFKPFPINIILGIKSYTYFLNQKVYKDEALHSFDISYVLCFADTWLLESD